MSSMISWDAAALRAPALPWAPLHHRLIKQEILEPSVNGFLSSHSEGFHSASPSSSSRDSNPQSPRSDSPSSPHQPPQTFRPLTPPGFDASPENRPKSKPQVLTAAVTPPKSPSPPPPWAHSDGIPSPGGDSAGEDDEPGLRVPAVNSHGKVKTFKCKQCEFVAVTKLDFWEHTKGHIKPERMLNCPKCPFVTEYKHHLEYHMRNHFGSKPFQCPQCSYSCVNKSMLNSHLKSHSNIYQYRCADCNYATKYCHSLKLHLRKYQHQPAMVLNQDGTPNPLPIIDVYGTRRGPKQRSSKNSEENNLAPQPHPMFNPFGMNFSYGSLLQHPMLFHNNNIPEPASLFKNDEHSSPNRGNESPNKRAKMESPHFPIQPRYFGDYCQISPDFVPAVVMHSPDRTSARELPYSPRQNLESPRRTPHEETNTDALDLTNSSTKMHHSNPPTPPPSLKNRRKGRAFKLERSIPRIEQPEEHIITPDMPIPFESEPEQEEIKVDIPSHIFDSIKDKYEAEKEAKNNPYTLKITEESIAPKPSKESYDCNHCDIIFKDIIMYTMHMGYHGYKDPFTCNMCGHTSADKVSFFVHIARSSHS